MTMPRIFLSHSSDDAAFANRLSNDLRRQGADVWLDSSHMAAGDFVARINQALQGRDAVVLVLSPAAIRSNWVTQEFNAAIARNHQGFMRPPLVILAKPCSLGDIPPMWTVYHRYDATQDYQGALNGLLQALRSPGTAQPIPVNTVSYAPAFAPPSSAVTYTDALTSNINDWGTDSRVSLKSDGLHIKNLKSLTNRTVGSWNTWPSLNNLGGNHGNMTLSINTRVLQNNGNAGSRIAFRAKDGWFNYAISVSPIGQWSFTKSQGPGIANSIVPWKESQAIRKGLNISNALKVIAVGTHFDFYINDVIVGEADDSTYASGKIGLVADYDMEIVYSGLVLTVW